MRLLCQRLNSYLIIKKLAYETDSWDLYLALKNSENVVVVDGRSKEVYQREHIPGAINQPHKEICFNNTEKLDKTKYISATVMVLVVMLLPKPR